MTSWSPPWPCSTESTPARIAFRTPTRLSAWAATGTSRLCASSTAAAISSIGQLRLAGLPAVVIIPPVAISLIEVAPARRFLRVARRTASGPSA